MSIHAYRMVQLHMCLCDNIGSHSHWQQDDEKDDGDDNEQRPPPLLHKANASCSLWLLIDFDLCGSDRGFDLLLGGVLGQTHTCGWNVMSECEQASQQRIYMTIITAVNGRRGSGRLYQVLARDTITKKREGGREEVRSGSKSNFSRVGERGEMCIGSYLDR